jgi:hypothetical protein
MGENTELNDKASTLFNIAYATGCLIAPILGGAINQKMTFRPTCDIMAFAAGGYGVIYFFINVIPFTLDKRRRQKIVREE